MALLALYPGCISKTSRDRSEAISQALEEQKAKTDNLRDAMRHLKQMTPVNRKQSAKEVQLELNTWLLSANRTDVNYSPSNMLRSLPEELLDAVGSRNPVALQFSYWDVDYLYGCRIADQLAAWIVSFPVRDNFMEPVLEKYAKQLSAADKLKLMDAYKLFDWTIRNISFEAAASSVEETLLDPRAPVDDSGIGYGYLPWETLLFSLGDFVERGRVFCSLADQRGIDTVWISIGADAGEQGKLWAIGVILADEILLFEPKLGLPILDPDQIELATLTQAQKNERILRRLDLAGQFDYAIAAADLEKLQFLIDVPPLAASARMKMLEQALLRDERMVLYKDVDAIANRLNAIIPDEPVSVWQTPLLAQVQAASVRERLDTPSPFSMNYMAMHGVWLLDNPAAHGRLKHLAGEFENTLDTTGALKMYMDSRVDDDSIEKLAYDPQVQRELGAGRVPGESREQHEMRIMQAQYIIGQSKVDAAFLMAQLHFDRGNYSDTVKWLRTRVLDDPRAQKWWSTGHYLLARAYQETGDAELAAKELTYQPSPQEAGNRLRLRYLQRQLE